MKFDHYRDLLESRKKSIRCRQLLKVLKDMGFKVVDVKKGGHKVYRHPNIPSFPGGNFNCGHSEGDEVRQCYIEDILDVIDDYETDLRRHLGEK